MVELNGGTIIAERLSQHGVQHIFTLCGGHISPILVGAKQAGLKVVDVRDEASAVFAADAVARMTGIVGVAAVTAGPGVTNTITAVKNAQMAQSPLIIFAGATPTVLMGRGSLQDIDQLELMKPLVKWATSVRTVKSLGPAIDKAVEIATSGVPGPVFIEVPIDVLYPESLVKETYNKEAGLENATGLAANALKLYLNAHIKRQFHQPHLGLSFPSLSLRGATQALTEQGQLKRALKAIEGAERPVLVVGSQALVNYTREDAQRLAEAVNKLNIPVWLGGTARGLLGRFSDIQFRHQRGAALKHADVVLVMGFPFDFRLKYGRAINAKATLIAANLSVRDLTKNRRPDIPLLAHPGSTIEALAESFQGAGRWQDWFADCRLKEQARDAEIEQLAGQTSDKSSGKGSGKGVNPIAFFLKMEQAMADDAVLVVDGGDFVATGAYTVRPRSPLSWLDPGVFGTLGVGGGFAIGASLVRPKAETWIIYGDGSSAYSLAEVDTCVRHGLAPIMVIGTDASWSQIAREQVEILGDDCATSLRFTDYHSVVEGYGGVGILVTELAQVDAVLRDAKAHAAAGRPVCINVHLAASDFRKGSISM